MKDLRSSRDELAKQYLAKAAGNASAVAQTREAAKSARSSLADRRKMEAEEARKARAQRHIALQTERGAHKQAALEHHGEAYHRKFASPEKTRVMTAAPSYTRGGGRPSSAPPSRPK